VSWAWLAYHWADEEGGRHGCEVAIVIEQGRSVQTRASRQLGQQVIARDDMQATGTAAVDQLQMASAREYTKMPWNPPPPSTRSTTARQRIDFVANLMGRPCALVIMDSAFESRASRSTSANGDVSLDVAACNRSATILTHSP
jgi:hypothetical protein